MSTTIIVIIVIMAIVLVGVILYVALKPTPAPTVITQSAPKSGGLLGDILPFLA